MLRHLFYKVLGLLDRAEVCPDGDLKYIGKAQLLHGRPQLSGCHLGAELSHKGRSHSGVYPLSCLDGADHLEDLGLVRNGSKGTIHQAHAAGNAFVIVDICFSVLV